MYLLGCSTNTLLCNMVSDVKMSVSLIQIFLQFYLLQMETILILLNYCNFDIYKERRKHSRTKQANKLQKLLYGSLIIVFLYLLFGFVKENLIIQSTIELS